MAHLKKRAYHTSSSKQFRQQLAKTSFSTYTKRKKRVTFVISTGIVGAVVLSLAIMIVLNHAVNATENNSTSVNVPAGYSSLNHPGGTCGNTGQVACPNVAPGWVYVASESAGDVTAAIMRSNEFRSMQAQYMYNAVDTPVLVHAFAAHTGNPYYDNDHWLASVHTISGARCGLFDFVYDRSTHSIRFSSFGDITSQDLHSRMAFPYISSSTAMARLQSQRRLRAMVGTQLRLIFFPIDPNYPNLNSPVHQWSGGGSSPMNPMWQVVGSDRQNYFIGTDLSVNTQATLPIAKGQP